MPLLLKNVLSLILVWYAGVRLAYWLNKKIEDDKLWDKVFLGLGFVVMVISGWIFWPAG